MKNILSKIVFLSCVVLFFNSCSNELDETVDSSVNNVEVINGGSMLKFKDQTAFDATVTKLQNMNDQELNAWSESIGFTSLQSVYVDALKQVTDLDLSSVEAYAELKEKYSEALYFPEYKEDYGMYIPVSKKEYAAFLNKEGNVMIGNEIKNFVDITDYESLQKTGQALYDLPKAELRASQSVLYRDIYFQVINKSEGGLIGDSFESEYIRGDYKVNLGVFRMLEAGTGAAMMVFNVDVRKKTASGWSNYYPFITLTGDIDSWSEDGFSVNGYNLPVMQGYGTLSSFVKKDNHFKFDVTIWSFDSLHKRCFNATSWGLTLTATGLGELKQNVAPSYSIVDLAKEKSIAPGDFKIVLDQAYYIAQ